MRETKFIEQNQEKWAEYEEMLRQNRKDPDKLNDLFVQITDDLSYARTFYPNRSVRVYLNGLAQQILHSVYRGRRFPMSRLWRFWADEMPQVMWEARRTLWLSFAIFAFAVLLGVVSSMIEPDFARIILGDGYVDMTIENIEKGDPMAVYKQREAFGMSLGIALNNLWVALLTAILGVLASLGTVFLLLTNGIMLGSFQWFFVERGLFWDSFLTIWIHGTLEISAIIIAGAAGLTAGSGLLFPGTYRRLQAFQISARRGMKIFIGLVPVFALAAFFEGFLTRFTQTPDVVRGAFILASLAFVLWYFVWLPHWKARRGDFSEPLRDKELPPDRPFVLDFREIKTSGEIFSDVFTVLKRHPGTVMGSVVAASMVFVLAAFGFSGQPPADTFTFPSELNGAVSGAEAFFGGDKMAWLFHLQIVLLMGLTTLVFKVLEREMPDGLRPVLSGSQSFAAMFSTVPYLATLAYIFRASHDIGCWLFLVFLCPVFSLTAFVLRFESLNLFSAFLRAMSLMRWSVGFLIGLIAVNFGVLLFLFLDSPVFGLFAEFLSMSVQAEGDNVRNFTAVLLTFVASSFIYFSIWTIMLSGALQYFSYREISDALSLREGIEQVGQSRKIRGLARE